MVAIARPLPRQHTLPNWVRPWLRGKIYVGGSIVLVLVLLGIVGPLIAPFNPFTDTPKECPKGTAAADCAAMNANWQLDPNFGKATNKDAYQVPRTYRFAVGVRF